MGGGGGSALRSQRTGAVGGGGWGRTRARTQEHTYRGTYVIPCPLPGSFELSPWCVFAEL